MTPTSSASLPKPTGLSSPVASECEPLRERLLIYATALTGDVNRAEDLVQETFLQYLKGRSRNEPKGRLIDWLRGILRKVALQEARSLKRIRIDEQTAQAVAVVLDRWHEQSNTHPQPAEDALERCLRRVDPIGRRLLQLRYEQSVPLKSIAHQFQKSIAWVKVSLHRVRKSLKRCLDGQRHAPASSSK